MLLNLVIILVNLNKSLHDIKKILANLIKPKHNLSEILSRILKNLIKSWKILIDLSIILEKS